MIVHSDLVNTQSLSQTEDGYKAERTFYVTGLTGSKESRLYQAMQESGIPAFGDPHPIVPGIFVTDIQAEPISKDGEKAKISVLYEPPSDDSSDPDTGGAVSVTSNTLIETVHKDVSGELLWVDYYDQISIGMASYSRAVKTASVQRPQVSVNFRRIEDQLPKESIEIYIGTINGMEWSGFPPKTWLCNSIIARPNKGKYEVEYSFSYRRDSWRASVAMTVNGVIPNDAIEGNGLATYDVYEERNFNDLGLSF